MSLKKFYADPYLHIRSFTLHFLGMAAVCWALYTVRPPEFFEFTLHLWHLLLIIPALYVAGMSAVFIHNATHNSFPNKLLNDICGEIAGIHQLWGFLGWKLIHLIHHNYSDKGDLDPHPPKGMTFLNFTKLMFLKSSFQITKRYREHWGEGLRTRILRAGVYVTFLGMAASNLLFWYLLLGPEGFVFFYVPSFIANHLFFAHINYYAHPVNEETGETAPANMVGHWYYTLCNKLFHGIYYHGNHHRKPNLFNPGKMPARTAKPIAVAVEAREEELAA